MATGPLFRPYVAAALEATKQGTSYFHEDVREQAYLALPGFIHAAQPQSAASSGVVVHGLSLLYSIASSSQPSLIL